MHAAKVSPNSGASGPVAVLFQAAAAPAVDGIAKPMKPGGYADSGADIAWTLRAAGRPVVTPVAEPDPAVQEEWVFPDDAAGLAAAAAAGAQVVWANTVLFAGHPLEAWTGRFGVVGQVPSLTQQFDDKALTNALLRAEGLPTPAMVLVGERPAEGVVALSALNESVLAAHRLAFPLVVKPVRGRGSQGVARVASLTHLRTHIETLFSGGFGQRVMVEAYLAGPELTLAVMPPGTYTWGGRPEVRLRHWALPAVARFNHVGGVAPYSGEIAVVRNSAALGPAECAMPALSALAHDCARAAALVGARAPIRIDCRADASGRFRLFDLNMKPNVTGAGRPGRDDQDSLLCLAGRAAGWSYGALLQAMLDQAWRT